MLPKLKWGATQRERQFSGARGPPLYVERRTSSGPCAGQRQWAAADTPLGGRFIRKTKGIITRADRPRSQKLSRYAIMDDCRRMNPYSCPYACCWAAIGPLAAKFWLMPWTALLNWLLYAVA